jgi:hypothetical protein
MSSAPCWGRCSARCRTTRWPSTPTAAQAEACTSAAGQTSAAGEAFILGQQDTYAARRTEAIARAWNSADLIPADRKRVALLVKEELDGLGQLGAVPGPERTLDVVAAQRLASPDDDRLVGLKLDHLLTS